MTEINQCLSGKNILLGVTGSIAAYKSAELIRLLKELGADVRVIMSEGSSVFITPMTLQALSGNRIYQSLLDIESEAEMSHITLARWADLILIAPATAHMTAKLANGFADDLLTTACLATTAPIAVAPAMNVMMWLNAATQENIQKLQNRNVHIIGPEVGIQACGETGEGRMMEPENIVKHIQKFFQKTGYLQGKRLLITAGPTQEAIDPVRYITNHSSGKMGYAIAEAAISEGAEVTLISGPTSLMVSSKIKKIDVISAQQMFDSVMKYITHCDIFISTAAVSDYRVSEISHQKIKKTNDFLKLELRRTPDILSTVSQLNPRPLMVGFAAETENLVENAKMKLHQKRLDIIVANLVGEDRGFCSDFNELVVMNSRNDTIKNLPYSGKYKLACDLITILRDYISDSETQAPGSAPDLSIIV